MSTEAQINESINHLFRHESGKMVSVLTRIFGAHNIDLVEDVVQDTLLKALEQWRFSGIPDNPAGWLYTVAKNKALDLIRREKLKNSFTEDISYLLKSEYTLIPTLHEQFSEPAIADDQLRMMFVCCHPKISRETQVSLILKTLCGFSISEIAAAFITNDEAIAKRIYRGKQVLRDENIRVELPQAAHIEERLEAVLQTLYLLFNEGYSSTSGDEVIRRDLIEEALRLAVMLTNNPLTAMPQVYALVALICFHAARLPGRVDADGNILLLADQDRSGWDKMLIAKGLDYLDRSASGDEITSYHIEAAIASIHSTADSSEHTDWTHIVELYDKLYSKNNSPVTALNRAIAIAQTSGAEAGLSAINDIANLELLSEYFLLPATIGEFHYRLHDIPKAMQYFNDAISLTNSARERKLLEAKMAKCR